MSKRSTGTGQTNQSGVLALGSFPKKASYMFTRSIPGVFWNTSAASLKCVPFPQHHEPKTRPEGGSSVPVGRRSNLAALLVIGYLPASREGVLCHRVARLPPLLLLLPVPGGKARRRQLISPVIETPG